MNQTDNYLLSQWEEEDRIIRTDFNSDNAKIDMALKANADAIASEAAARKSAVSAEASARQSLANSVKLQRITGTTLSAATTGFNVSLSGISWGSYRCVHMLLDVKLADSIQYSAVLNSNALYSLSSRGLSPIHAVLWPLCDSSRRVDGVAHGGVGYFCYPALAFRDLSTLHLSIHTSGGQFLTGTSVTLYGERN